MKQILLHFFLLLPYFISAQSRSHLEIMPFIRYDSYPEISYNYLGRAYANHLKLEGSSWGANFYYKFYPFKNWGIKSGAGYYRYSFDYLQGYGPWGPTNGRDISGPVRPTFDMVATDGYWYNCFSFCVGVEKVIPVKNWFQVVTGLNFSRYNTYSQEYHLTRGADMNWMLQEKGHLGYSGTFQLGLTKSLLKYRIGPAFILPIYDTWQTDYVFSETEFGNEAREKTFKGWGFGLTFARSL